MLPRAPLHHVVTMNILIKHEQNVQIVLITDSCRSGSMGPSQQHGVYYTSVYYAPKILNACTCAKRLQKIDLTSNICY
jgi:hypothetical protein